MFSLTETNFVSDSFAFVIVYHKKWKGKKKKKTLSNKKQQFWFQILLHLFLVAKKEKEILFLIFLHRKRKRKKTRVMVELGPTKRAMLNTNGTGTLSFDLWRARPRAFAQVHLFNSMLGMGSQHVSHIWVWPAELG